MGRLQDRRLQDKVERAVHGIEGQAWLDLPSYKIEHGYALTLTLLHGGDRFRNLLHGIWLGHPLHPPLTDIPIGAWTAAMVLDVSALAGRPGARGAARTCVGLGLAGAGAAAVTGLTDWQYTHDNARRVGLVHGVLNLTATGLYAASWLLRGRGRGHHRIGVALSAVGYLVTGTGAYLGGVLVSRHRIGVDHSDDRLEPRTFTAVIAERDLIDGKPVQVEADGASVTLVRSGERVYAFADACSHLGASLSEGWLHRGTLVCPWHGSRFALDDGRVVAGPATAPIPCLEVRCRAGQVEIHRPPPVPGAPPGSVVATEQAAADARH